MIDAATSQPIQLRMRGDAISRLRVRADQIGQIRELFDRHGVDYWVESDVISVDGKPYIGYVHLTRRNDPRRVQAILDQVN